MLLVLGLSLHIIPMIRVMGCFVLREDLSSLKPQAPTDPTAGNDSEAVNAEISLFSNM